MATAANEDILYNKENKLGVTTFTFRSKRYSFPSVIVKSDLDSDHGICVMLDVGLFCPFCSGNKKSSKYTQRRSRLSISSKGEGKMSKRKQLVDKATLSKPDLSVLDTLAIQTSSDDVTRETVSPKSGSPLMLSPRSAAAYKEFLKPDITVVKKQQHKKIAIQPSSPDICRQTTVFTESEPPPIVLSDVVAKEKHVDKPNVSGVKVPERVFPTLKDLACNVLTVTQRRSLYENGDIYQKRSHKNVIKTTSKQTKQQKVVTINKNSKSGFDVGNTEKEGLISLPVHNGKLNADESTHIITDNDNLLETSIENTSDHEGRHNVSITYGNNLNNKANLSVNGKQDYFEPLNSVNNCGVRGEKEDEEKGHEKVACVIESIGLSAVKSPGDCTKKNLSSRAHIMTITESYNNTTHVKVPREKPLVEVSEKKPLCDSELVCNINNKNDIIAIDLLNDFENNNNQNQVIGLPIVEKLSAIEKEEEGKRNYNGNLTLNCNTPPVKSTSSLEDYKHTDSVGSELTGQDLIVNAIITASNHVDMDKQILINRNNQCYSSAVVIDSNQNSSDLIEHVKESTIIGTGGTVPTQVTTTLPLKIISSSSYHKSDDKLWTGGGSSGDLEIWGGKRSAENLLIVDQCGSFSNAGSEAYLMDELITDHVLDNSSGVDDDDGISEQYKYIDENTLRAIEQKLLQNLAKIEAEDKKEGRKTEGRSVANTQGGTTEIIGSFHHQSQNIANNNNEGDYNTNSFSLIQGSLTDDCSEDTDSRQLRQGDKQVINRDHQVLDNNNSNIKQQNGYQYTSRDDSVHSKKLLQHTDTITAPPVENNNENSRSSAVNKQGLFNIKNGGGKFNVIKKKDKSKTVLGLEQQKDYSSGGGKVGVQNLSSTSDQFLSPGSAVTMDIDCNACDVGGHKHVQGCCRVSPESLMEEILDGMDEQSVETFSGDATLGRVFSVSSEKKVKKLPGKSETQSLRSPLDEATCDIGEFYNFMKLIQYETDSKAPDDTTNNDDDDDDDNRKKMFTLGSGQLFGDEMVVTASKASLTSNNGNMDEEVTYGSLNDLLDEEILCAAELNETFSVSELPKGMGSISEQLPDTIVESEMGDDSLFNSSAEASVNVSKNEILVDEIFEDAFEHALEGITGDVDGEDDIFKKDWTSDYESDVRGSNDTSKTTSLDKRNNEEMEQYKAYLKSLEIQSKFNKNNRTSSVDCTIGDRTESRLSEVGSIDNRTSSIGSYSKGSVSSGYSLSDEDTDDQNLDNQNQSIHPSLQIPFKQIILDTNKMTKDLVEENNSLCCKNPPVDLENSNPDASDKKIRKSRPDEFNFEVSHTEKIAKQEELFHTPQNICSPKSPTIIKKPNISMAKTQKIPLLTSPMLNNTRESPRRESDLSETENIDVTRDDLYNPQLNKFINQDQWVIDRLAFDEQANKIEERLSFKRQPSADEMSQGSNLSSIDEFIPETEEYNAPPEVLEKAYKAAIQVAQMFQHHHVTHPCFQKIIEEISSSRESLNDSSRSNTLKRNKLAANKEKTIPEGEDVPDLNEKLVIDLVDTGKKEKEEIVVTQEDANTFLQHVLGSNHTEHKEKRKELKTIIKDDQCHSCVVKSDDNTIVKSEEITTQEVTLVFAWPKSIGKLSKVNPNQPFRELQMHRVMKVSDLDVEILEGPSIRCIEQSPVLENRTLLQHLENTKANDDDSNNAMVPSNMLNQTESNSAIMEGKNSQNDQIIADIDVKVKTTKFTPTESTVIVERQTKDETKVVDSITQNIVDILSVNNTVEYNHQQQGCIEEGLVHSDSVTTIEDILVNRCDTDDIRLYAETFVDLVFHETMMQMEQEFTSETLSDISTDSSDNDEIVLETPLYVHDEVVEGQIIQPLKEDIVSTKHDVDQASKKDIVIEKHNIDQVSKKNIVIEKHDIDQASKKDIVNDIDQASKKDIVIEKHDIDQASKKDIVIEKHDIDQASKKDIVIKKHDIDQALKNDIVIEKHDIDKYSQDVSSQLDQLEYDLCDKSKEHVKKQLVVENDSSNGVHSDVPASQHMIDANKSDIDSYSQDVSSQLDQLDSNLLYDITTSNIKKQYLVKNNTPNGIPSNTVASQDGKQVSLSPTKFNSHDVSTKSKFTVKESSITKNVINVKDETDSMDNSLVISELEPTTLLNEENINSSEKYDDMMSKIVMDILENTKESDETNSDVEVRDDKCDNNTNVNEITQGSLQEVNNNNNGPFPSDTAIKSETKTTFEFTSTSPDIDLDLKIKLERINADLDELFPSKRMYSSLQDLGSASKLKARSKRLSLSETLLENIENEVRRATSEDEICNIITDCASTMEQTLRTSGELIFTETTPSETVHVNISSHETLANQKNIKAVVGPPANVLDTIHEGTTFSKRLAAAQKHSIAGSLNRNTKELGMNKNATDDEKPIIKPRQKRSTSSEQKLIRVPPPIKPKPKLVCLKGKVLISDCELEHINFVEVKKENVTALNDTPTTNTVEDKKLIADETVKSIDKQLNVAEQSECVRFNDAVKGEVMYGDNLHENQDIMSTYTSTSNNACEMCSINNNNLHECLHYKCAYSDVGSDCNSSVSTCTVNSQSSLASQSNNATVNTFKCSNNFEEHNLQDMDNLAETLLVKYPSQEDFVCGNVLERNEDNYKFSLWAPKSDTSHILLHNKNLKSLPQVDSNLQSDNVLLSTFSNNLTEKIFYEAFQILYLMLAQENVAKHGYYIFKQNENGSANPVYIDVSHSDQTSSPSEENTCIPKNQDTSLTDVSSDHMQHTSVESFCEDLVSDVFKYVYSSSVKIQKENIVRGICDNLGNILNLPRSRDDLKMSLSLESWNASSNYQSSNVSVDNVCQQVKKTNKFKLKLPKKTPLSSTSSDVISSCDRARNALSPLGKKHATMSSSEPFILWQDDIDSLTWEKTQSVPTIKSKSSKHVLHLSYDDDDGECSSSGITLTDASVLNDTVSQTDTSNDSSSFCSQQSQSVIYGSSHNTLVSSSLDDNGRSSVSYPESCLSVNKLSTISASQTYSPPSSTSEEFNDGCDTPSSLDELVDINLAILNNNMIVEKHEQYLRDRAVFPKHLCTDNDLYSDEDSPFSEIDYKVYTHPHVSSFTLESDSSPFEDKCTGDNYAEELLSDKERITYAEECLHISETSTYEDNYEPDVKRQPNYKRRQNKLYQNSLRVEHLRRESDSSSVESCSDVDYTEYNTYISDDLVKTDMDSAEVAAQYPTMCSTHVNYQWDSHSTTCSSTVSSSNRSSSNESFCDDDSVEELKNDSKLLVAVNKQINELNIALGNVESYQAEDNLNMVQKSCEKESSGDFNKLQVMAPVINFETIVKPSETHAQRPTFLKRASTWSDVTYTNNDTKEKTDLNETLNVEVCHSPSSPSFSPTSTSAFNLRDDEFAKISRLKLKKKAENLSDVCVKSNSDIAITQSSNETMQLSENDNSDVSLASNASLVERGTESLEILCDKDVKRFESVLHRTRSLDSGKNIISEQIKAFNSRSVGCLLESPVEVEKVTVSKAKIKSIPKTNPYFSYNDKNRSSEGDTNIFSYFNHIGELRRHSTGDIHASKRIYFQENKQQYFPVGSATGSAVSSTVIGKPPRVPRIGCTRVTKPKL